MPSPEWASDIPLREAAERSGCHLSARRLNVGISQALHREEHAHEPPQRRQGHLMHTSETCTNLGCHRPGGAAETNCFHTCLCVAGGYVTQPKEPR